MNVMTSNPTAAQQMARFTIDQRVRDAEQRRFARTARMRPLHEKTLQPPSPTRTLPWWSFRFLRPAH